MTSREATRTAEVTNATAAHGILADTRLTFSARRANGRKGEQIDALAFPTLKVATPGAGTVAADVVLTFAGRTVAGAIARTSLLEMKQILARCQHLIHGQRELRYRNLLVAVDVERRADIRVTLREAHPHRSDQFIDEHRSIAIAVTRTTALLGPGGSSQHEQ